MIKSHSLMLAGFAIVVPLDDSRPSPITRGIRRHRSTASYRDGGDLRRPFEVDRPCDVTSGGGHSWTRRSDSSQTRSAAARPVGGSPTPAGRQHSWR
jgi:hypothetical protein